MSDKPVIAPNSPAAEEAVLGAILINPDALFTVDFLKPEHFYYMRNGWVLEAIRAIVDRGDAVDNVTVVDELTAQGRIEKIGGSAYITYLINNTPSHIHAETYGRLIERASKRRDLLTFAQDTAKRAVDSTDDVDTIIKETEAELYEVAQLGEKSGPTSLAELTAQHRDAVLDYKEGDTVPGILSGFTGLDTVLGGAQPGELTIVGARPGVGKTALLLNLAASAAKAGNRVLLFSLEMNKMSLYNRLIAAESGVNGALFRTPKKMTAEQYERYLDATSRVEKWPIYIDDTSGLTVGRIASRARKHMLTHGVDMIIGDYLQLVESDSKMENRVAEVTYISRRLKELCRELNIPSYWAAQLSRSVEQRADKRPVLSDLRESGAIEQDADIVLFLYRDELYDENTPTPNQAELHIAKHRNGALGMDRLYYDKTLTKFMNMRKTVQSFS